MLYPDVASDILPFSNALDRNRTSDTRIFSPLLYQLSYQGPFVKTTMPQAGIEPAREISPAGF
jgi:hypothetical protein